MIPLQLKELNKQLTQITDLQQFFGMRALLKYILACFNPVTNHHPDEFQFNSIIIPKMSPISSKYSTYKDFCSRIEELQNEFKIKQIDKAVRSKILNDGKRYGISEQTFADILNEDQNLDFLAMDEVFKLTPTFKTSLQISRFLIYIRLLQFKLNYTFKENKSFCQIYGGGFNYIDHKPHWKKFENLILKYLDRTWSNFVNKDVLNQDEIENANIFIKKFKEIIAEYFIEFTPVGTPYIKTNSRFISYFEDQNRKLNGGSIIRNVFKNFKCILGYLNANELNPSHIKQIQPNEASSLGRLSKSIKKNFNLILIPSEFRGNGSPFNKDLKRDRHTTFNFDQVNFQLNFPCQYYLYNENGNLIQSGMLASRQYEDEPIMIKQTQAIPTLALAIKVPLKDGKVELIDFNQKEFYKSSEERLTSINRKQITENRYRYDCYSKYKKEMKEFKSVSSEFESILEKLTTKIDSILESCKFNHESKSIDWSTDQIEKLQKSFEYIFLLKDAKEIQKDYLNFLKTSNTTMDYNSLFFEVGKLNSQIRNLIRRSKQKLL